MAKALLGYIGTVPDRRLIEEIAQLRSRVRLLQSELDALRAEQDERTALLVPDTPPVFAGAASA